MSSLPSLGLGGRIGLIMKRKRLWCGADQVRFFMGGSGEKRQLLAIATKDMLESRISWS